MEETDYAPKDWHSRIEKDTALTSTPMEADTNLRNISEIKKIPSYSSYFTCTPSAPAHLYMVPLSALKEPQVGMSTLAQYEMKSDRQFFYDAAKQDFKRN